MRQPKFIVTKEGDTYNVICGHVELHMNLVPDKTVRVIGGGLFYIDYRTGVIYFYGKSVDYGVVPSNVLKKAVPDNEDAIKKQISEIDGLCDADKIPSFKLETEDIPYFLLTR